MIKADDQIVIERCQRYLLEEPSARLKSELSSLLADGSPSVMLDVEDRIKKNLAFGTAGVRGKMEAGYNRMNLVSVYRLSYALGVELINDTSHNRSVVVGFDGRHYSLSFAEEVSLVLRAMGITVYFFDEPVPTPLCAYAAKFFKTTAAVMVTASHNPPSDNGVKLFNGTSAQTNGPLLKRIEERMNEAPLRFEFHDEQTDKIGDTRLKKIGNEVFQEYLHEIKSTQFLSQSAQERTTKMAYTPLHGVGKKLFLQAMNQEGYSNIVVVSEQAEPDGNFVTVNFPNPEESNTLDLAHKLGTEENCDLVLANDPDADRLQASCPDENNVMRRLTGNEMGVIFGYFALLRAEERGIKPLVASSIVSSRMLKVMCQQAGATYVDALTGFANIVQAAVTKESEQGSEFIFAYEEAIGFLIGRVVLDKDGIHAGVRFMEIMSYLKANGQTIWQLLDELYLRYGLFVNLSWSWRFHGPDAPLSMKNFMENIRHSDPNLVAKLLNQSECSRYDLLALQKSGPYEELRSDVVIYEIESRGRIIVRPSGTEPKIKFYVELWDQATDRQMLSNKRSKLGEMIVQLKDDIECLFGKKGT